MDKDTTLKLLNMFVDYGKPNIDKPFSQDIKLGKYLCATNGKIALLIPETNENKIDNQEGYNPPYINGIIPKVFLDNIEMDFNVIVNLYNDIPVAERPIMCECESCDGAGEFNHYNESYECKKCDGSGKFQTSMKEKSKNPDTLFQFKDNFIEMKYIVSMIHVFNTAKPKTFSIIHLGNCVSWFKLDQIYIAISGKMLDDKPSKHIITVPLS